MSFGPTPIEIEHERKWRTRMVVLNEPPPLYDLIDAHFHVKGTMAIFTFGNKIYAPAGGKVTRELIAHEEVHHQQQGEEWDGIEAWWRRYVVDHAFRFDQELPAHVAEYRAYCKRHGGGRVKFLNQVATRLSGPLYLGMISLEEATRRILCQP